LDLHERTKIVTADTFPRRNCCKNAFAAGADPTGNLTTSSWVHIAADRKEMERNKEENP